ncbi:hypothetical protein GCM10027051_27970 [Niabella terrae]
MDKDTIKVNKNIRAKKGRKATSKTDTKSVRGKVTKGRTDRHNEKSLLSKNSEPEFKAGNAGAINVIKKGITQGQLLNLKEKIGLDYEKLSYIVGVTRQTLTKKDKNATYKVPASEKIYRIAELYSYGYYVFENKEGFNEWMRTENAALGNKKPIDFLDTMYGFQEVKDLIGRIDWGIFS